MPNFKFTFATADYGIYVASLKHQVPDIMVEEIDTKGLSMADSKRKCFRQKLSITDYFQNGDKVIFIDCDVIVNKNLDDLFDKVNEECPICFQYITESKHCFNSGLFVLLVNAHTRALYKRALELYDSSAINKWCIADEPYVCLAMKEFKTKANECDCLQSFSCTELDYSCYVNHFSNMKDCDLYRNFLSKVSGKSTPYE